MLFVIFGDGVNFIFIIEDICLIMGIVLWVLKLLKDMRILLVFVIEFKLFMSKCNLYFILCLIL